MTLDTFNKIKKHIDVIELIVIHANDPGHGRLIINEMINIQKEYKDNPKPVDTSCPACIMELFQDVYRYYKLYENTFS